MLSINEAMEKLLATVMPLEVVDQSLSKTLGLTLAQDVYSQVDSPPFDKSSMDGYAVKSTDVVSGSASLRVIEVVTAGCVPQIRVGSGEATQIMTGAPLPEGADVVVKVEETRRDGDFVLIATGSVATGTNVIRCGNSVRKGDLVLSAGTVLNGARIGALAELGQVSVRVRPRPRVAILATGNELVSIEKVPGPGQIRNSNGAMLAAQAEVSGCTVVSLGIARDDRHDLRSKIIDGLECDILVLSGGVSAGTLDLVPGTLAEADVQEVFHKVELKPGKPIWFGVCRRSCSNAVENSGNIGGESTLQHKTCYVFGLPGNPVSSLVCFELFARTAIRRLMGIEPATPQPILARLVHDHSTRLDRPTYHPASLTWTIDGLAVKLVPWMGSSDLCSTVAANGMAFLPGEARQYRAGDRLETFAW